MKGKYIMIVSIGLVTLILTAIIFTQFKTIEQTDITAIETMRETELRTELADWKTKYEEIKTKLTETENKITEYQSEISNSEESSSILDKELNETKTYLGYTKVQVKELLLHYQIMNTKQ